MGKVFSKYNRVRDVGKINDTELFQHIETDWIVTERVYGRRFAIYIDSKKKKISHYAITSGIIDNSKKKNLIDYKSIVNNINIDKIVDNTNDNIDSNIKYKVIVLYGVIFGNNKHSKYSPKYSKDYMFRVDDIALLNYPRAKKECNVINKQCEYINDLMADNISDNSLLVNQIASLTSKAQAPSKKYVSWDTMNKILEDSNLLTVPLLNRYDNLNDAISYDCKNESALQKSIDSEVSTIDEMYGCIIRSNEPIYRHGKRAIFKKLNDKYVPIVKRKNNLIIYRSDIFKTLKKSIIDLITDDYIHGLMIDNDLYKLDCADKFKTINQIVINRICNEFESKIEQLKILNEYKALTSFLNKIVLSKFRAVCDTIARVDTYYEEESVAIDNTTNETEVIEESKEEVIIE